MPSREVFIKRAVSEVLNGRVATPLRGMRGVGKTTILGEIVTRLRENGRFVVAVPGEESGPLAIQAAIAEAAGLRDLPRPPPQDLFRYLATDRQIDFLVLAIEGADRFSTKTFHYLSLLLDLSNTGTVKVQLVLFGALGPWPGLVGPDLTRLRDEMMSVDVLWPLDRAEAAAYVQGKFLGPDQPHHKLSSRVLRDVLDHADGIPARLDELTRSSLAGEPPPHRAGWTWDELSASFHPTNRPLSYAAAAACLVAAVGVAGWQLEQRYGADTATDAAMPDAAPTEIAASRPAPAIPTLPPRARVSPVPRPAEIAVDKSADPPAVANTQVAVPSPAAPPPAVPVPPPRQVDPPAAQMASLAPASLPLPFAAPSHIPVPLAVRPASPPAIEPWPQLPLLEPSGAPAPQKSFLTDMAMASISHGRRGPGLILLAQGGDTMRLLYTKVYRGLVPPPYAEVVALNPEPIRRGAMMVFPEPPNGWTAGNPTIANNRPAN